MSKIRDNQLNVFYFRGQLVSKSDSSAIFLWPREPYPNPNPVLKGIACKWGGLVVAHTFSLVGLSCDSNLVSLGCFAVRKNWVGLQENC